MSDLISRQETLRTLPNLCIGFDCLYCPFHNGDDMTRNCLLEQWANSLPSAQPESCGDVISREYLKEHIEACWINGRPRHAPELNELLSWIDDVPPAHHDRDIPRKPIEGCSLSGRKKVKEASCPNCSFFLSHYRFYGEGKRITYCEHCGQAIDWEGWEWDD